VDRFLPDEVTCQPVESIDNQSSGVASLNTSQGLSQPLVVVQPIGARLMFPRFSGVDMLELHAT
jgi:hypothetical protein